MSHEDAIHAVLNAHAIADVPGRPGEATKVFVGHPHPQTDRYLEVMELSDLYRDLLD